MIDLHAHSTASDGSLAPDALVRAAAQKGLSALALTDHDTIAGLAEARRAASESGIRFIPGVELEIAPSEMVPGTEFGKMVPGTKIKGEFHLLGLGIDKPSGEFVETLRELAGARERRNFLMIEKMKAAGIEVELADIAALAGGNVIGRPHFGLFLIKNKIVKNQEQAFKRYLGKGRPFFVPKEGLEFETAARLIHDSGGIAVLAHPMSLYVAWGRLPDVIGRLKELGLDGLEAWHPNARVSECRRLSALARSFNLKATAGSDFHGENRPERKLGITAGGRKIEDEFLEDLFR